MRVYLSLLLCAFQFIITAQDTIYKKPREVISCKIIEITPKTVSYKRFDLLDGPTYVVDKNEIKKIRYQTGAVDSFNVVVEEVPEKKVEDKSWIVMGEGQNSQGSPGEYIQMMRHPAKYKYKGRPINDKQALIIADVRNRTWKNKDLDLHINAARDYHRNQLIAGFGGLGLGLISAVAGLNLIAQGYGDQAAYGAFVMVNGVGLFIAGQIVSGAFKSKRMKNTQKAIALYNQNLQ